MISFLLGLLLGGAVGVVVAALCAAAKDGEDVPAAKGGADYKRLYERLMALPNCNDCAGAKDCPCRPEWGGTVRVNCPLHTTAAAAATAGVDFWRELLPDLRAACGPAAYPFLSSGALCAGTLHGDVLTVQVKDAFSCRMVNKPRVLEGITTAATAKAGRPIQVLLLHAMGPEDA
ncbi:MAG: hypothetical protein LUF28_09190 [Clostridiales bacterium]|nr:hypothetical protein [Clostridiales bacterium]